MFTIIRSIAFTDITEMHIYTCSIEMLLVTVILEKKSGDVINMKNINIL